MNYFHLEAKVVSRGAGRSVIGGARLCILFPDSTMIMTDLPMTTPESTGVCIAKSFFRSMHQKNGRTDSYSGKLSSP